jgi:cephalosporin-C deacetylase
MTVPVTRHRWEGLRAAWTDAGHPAAELRLAVCPVNHAAEGEAFAAELLGAADPPDAIAAMSDELALGALRAAASAGVSVPADLAVTGWDDRDAAAPTGLATLTAPGWPGERPARRGWSLAAAAVAGQNRGMPQFDLPQAELARYRSAVVEPDDFDEFWAATLAGARREAPPAQVRAVASPMRLVDIYDVRFPGWNGEPIAAWLLLPAGLTEPPPCVVAFPGYGNGRGLPHQHLLYPATGLAVLAVDARGQGAGDQGCDTGDSEAPGRPQYPRGFLTRGITDPATYYYRRLITDCVRAVDFAAARSDLIDPGRIAVSGGSQGGGLALAVGALHPAVRAVAAAVPFLCDFPRGITLTDSDPYAEIAKYLAGQRADIAAVLRTLSYVDGVVFAARAGAPALFSVGLMDQVCPPSTVYAAYHAYAGPRELTVFPFNGHEGGGAAHEVTTVDFLLNALTAIPADPR